MRHVGEIMRQRAHASARVKPGKAFFVEFERKPGWSRALPIYVIWCCGVATETHPAGYGRISCGKCRKGDTVMTWARFRDRTLPKALIATPMFGIILLALTLIVLLALR